MMYGYARVSTDGQSVEAQVAALRAAGAVNVYREVTSGAQTDRAQLRQGLARLAAGAVRMVTRLDRLARSTRDLLTVLGGLTEFERELIRARTSEGRARAQARGVRLGRRPKFTPTKSVRRSAAARTASH